MELVIKKVLKKIENSGHEAYIVGGYVRDYVLGEKTYDIDICTNALPKELIKIFPNSSAHNYGGISFKIKKYNFDITTYRKEINYKKRKPVKIEYINSLLEDIYRRDFKINALCINSKGNVIDLIGGIQDIKNKQISTIGECSIKFSEDPLRMLRAIRFMTTLDFELDKEINNSIINNKDKILTLSENRIKDELDKILISKNVLKGLNFLCETGILKLLNINFGDIKYVADLSGMWAQLKMDFNSAFTKEEKNTIINIRKILDGQKIDKEILFEYGLYQSLVAGEILGINKATINRIYKCLPIYTKKDLAISPSEIMEILHVGPGEIISAIINDVTYEILNGNLKNNYREIKKFILAKKAVWIR